MSPLHRAAVTVSEDSVGTLLAQCLGPLNTLSVAAGFICEGLERWLQMGREAWGAWL